MRIQSVSSLWRVIDLLMIPVMWVLCECKDLQESHIWHFQSFSCPLIPDSAGITIVGDETSWVQEHHKALVHMPIFGGWKKYVVIEAQNFENYWHVGWKVKYFDSNKKEKCEIQKLRIYNSQIRLLVGQNDSVKLFFGLNSNGKVISVKKVGEGMLGDNKFPGARLF